MPELNYYVPDNRPWFKHYFKDGSKHLNYPEVPLYDFLDDSAEENPNKKAIIFYDKEITYKELKNLSDRFAFSLQKQGIHKGDRIVLLLPNCPQLLISFWGTLKAGAIPICLNPLYTGEELKYFFNDAEPRIVISLDMFYEKVEEGAESTSHIEKIITTNIADYFPLIKKVLGKLLGKVKYFPCPGTINFNDFLESSSNYNRVEINPKEDLAMIVYTGGTTGDSKGVMLTHFNVISDVLGMTEFLKEVSIKSLLIVVPPFHVYGLISGISMGTYNGWDMVFLPKFTTEETIKTIRKYKINFFEGVPAMYSAFWNYFQKKPKESLLDSLTLCSSGSTSISSYLWKKINKMAPNATLIEGYGLTESSQVILLDSLVKGYVKKMGSVGIPIHGCDLKIVDIETREDLPLGQSGEILFKGPQVFKGYWKKPEKTKKVFENGWLRTKDIGRMDKDGVFYIEGRIDDMIDVRGEKVWPREVEKVLESNPAVQEAAVIGIKDDYYGQTIKACVVLREGKGISEKDLIDYCKENIVPFKVPHKVEFFKDLPKSHMGKVLHYKLRKNK
jgi:long-chain acyl-CoA synthetase